MKIIYLLLVLSAITFFSAGQEYRFSANIFGGSMYYLASSNSTTQIKQDGNFDAGLLFSYRPDKVFEIKAGLAFFSKRFSEYYDYSTPPPPYYETENHYFLYYYRLPLVLGFHVWDNKKFDVYINTGLSLAHLFAKDRSSHYANGSVVVGFDSLTYYYRDPLYFDFGGGIKYHLKDNLSINLEPWFRYMYLDDFIRVKDAYTVSLSHSEIGLHVGIVYDFNLPKK